LLFFPLTEIFGFRNCVLINDLGLSLHLSKTQGQVFELQLTVAANSNRRGRAMTRFFGEM
jgi:hypothetical protein